MMRSRLFSALIAAMALVSSACNTTTAPDIENSAVTPAEMVTVTFAGTLEPKDNQFYSVLVGQEGAISVTLAALQAPGGAALTTPVGIGIGVPKGTGCVRTSSLVTPPGLSAQLTVILNPGTYCIAVYDSGTLASAVNFATRIRYPS
ncbi:MAG: hypothetical protein IT185_11480 [Acidobacteria bacterium]|jgi:hypothetical protein|nr:hypothetical protein [Acidobacteriota bacterium]